jgi:N-acetylneuraminate 9-O-acetyltransferase
MTHAYTSSDISYCLNLVHLTVYGEMEACVLSQQLAENFDTEIIRNTTNVDASTPEGTIILASSHAEVTYRYWPAYTPWPSNIPASSPIWVTQGYDDPPPRLDTPAKAGKYFFFKKNNQEDRHYRSQAVLNYFCNDMQSSPWYGRLKFVPEHWYWPSQAYCCTRYVKPDGVQQVLMVASSVVIVYNLISSMLRLTPFFIHDEEATTGMDAQHLRWAITMALIAALSCFVADRTPFLDTASKSKDMLTFVCLMSLFIVIGVLTRQADLPRFEQSFELKPHIAKPVRFLSRQQTEEWKGWMQIVILLYHYFGMSKVLWIYQLVRVLVASYLFMTGFGHATYFTKTGDFSTKRVTTVMVRTNILNIILSWVLGTSYELYYFPMLTSVWFILTWITIPRRSSMRLDLARNLRAIGLCTMIARLLLGNEVIISSLLRSVQGRFGFPNFSIREFDFRFNLDVYVVPIGMASAVLLEWYKTQPDIPSPRNSWIARLTRLAKSKALPALAALSLFLYMLFCSIFNDKVYYNQWHPFVSPLAVMAFGVLRNSRDCLRTHHSRLFAWIGRCSLELFVLQYHLWLAADSHGILQLGLLKQYDLPSNLRNVVDVFEIACILAVFITISHFTAQALSIITKSLVARSRLSMGLVIGLWVINWVLQSGILGNLEELLIR